MADCRAGEGPAPPGGLEGELGRFQGGNEGRREEQDKGQVSTGRLQLPTVRAVTGILQVETWGQIQKGAKILRSLSRNPHSHNKNTGVNTPKG